MTFRTKPTIARRLLVHAARRGLPLKWVTGDEVYGDDPKLRTWLARQPYHFVLAIKCNQHVWSVRPEVQLPASTGQRGRPRTRSRVTTPSMRVDTLVAAWPTDVWTRLAVREGEKGPVEYDWAARRVVDKVGTLPDGDRWLLVRRSIHEPFERAYYLSDARRRRPWRNWPASRPVATRSSSASGRPRTMWDWTSTKCAAGWGGTATSRCA